MLHLALKRTNLFWSILAGALLGSIFAIVVLVAEAILFGVSHLLSLVSEHWSNILAVSSLGVVIWGILYGLYGWYTERISKTLYSAFTVVKKGFTIKTWKIFNIVPLLPEAKMAQYVYRQIIEAYVETGKVFVGSIHQFEELGQLKKRGRQSIRHGFDTLEKWGYIKINHEEGSFRPTSKFDPDIVSKSN
jgi:hypothetical protein